MFSVCTGALLCGAAGLLQGRRATTHWASFHLLPFFGAIPVDERVVVDGNWVFAAGVTAGIDGALRLAAELRGDDAAQAIQLHMVYAPEPPFDSGTPETAPAAILEQARHSYRDITAQREATAQAHRRPPRRHRLAWRETRGNWRSRQAPPDHIRGGSARATSQEHAMTTITFTKTTPPDGCWRCGRRSTTRPSARASTASPRTPSATSASPTGTAARRSARTCATSSTQGFTAHHDVVEYLDSPLLKVFHGKVSDDLRRPQQWRRCGRR